ncbi:glutaredoxin domain-containing protein [Solirubrobacter soli]|nr:glutaredoxin domain-containing protein [Solirubrobacter soli]
MSPVADVTLYTKPMCRHGFRAKRRLRRHGVTIHEIHC